MGIPRSFLASALTIVIALLCVDVAEGYFLSSYGHRGVRDHSAQASDHEAKLQEMPPETTEAPRAQLEKQYHPAKHYGASPGGIDADKYPFIAASHDNLSSIFGKYSDDWWKDWKLWVGMTCWLAVWAKRAKYGYDEHDEIFWHRVVFTFGLNVAILHVLQYASTIKMGMLTVCLLLSGQAVVQSAIWFQIEQQKEQEHSEQEVAALTMYLDLSLPLEQIAMVFVAQILIFWFFLTSILGNFNFASVNYMFWMTAFIAMQMTMIFSRGEDSALGFAFPCHDVYRLWLKCDDLTLKQKDGKYEAFTISKTNILIRGALGFFCNAILREIMAYTIPLMLMGFTEPMDFVVYCVGVNFICTVDDMKKKRFSFNPESARGGGVGSAKSTSTA